MDAMRQRRWTDHVPAKRLFCVVCLLIVFCFTSGASAQEFREVLPGVQLNFPEELYYQPDYRIQWWYFTGHLFDDKGREFGYELTLFVVGVQKRAYESKFGVDNIYISHFAVTDVKGRQFLYSDDADSGAYGFAGASKTDLRVWVDKDILNGSMEKMHIAAYDPRKGLDLMLIPEKPVVLEGDRGYSRKSDESPLIASYYFSFTDLKSNGTLKIGENEFRVSGKSWFDRELSSRGLGEKEKGWDWFSMQLEGGKEVMLYMIRKSDGSIGKYSSGTVVQPNGKYRRLSAREFEVTVLDHYKSQKTGARYPSRWNVKIPSESLSVQIVPLIKDQEFVARFSTGNYYWEGACEVSGSAKGRAYVELTGY